MNSDSRIGRSRYYLPSTKLEGYNFMIDGENFDQPIRNDIKTYDIIRKIATGQADDYTAIPRLLFTKLQLLY